MLNQMNSFGIGTGVGVRVRVCVVIQSHGVIIFDNFSVPCLMLTGNF